MTDVAIRTEDLTRHFGAVRALEGLDLEVPRGQVFAFLGPNGAGKTTTMHLLLGILRPTRGRAEVLGLDPARNADQVRARCGALLEHHGVYERMTAVENLEFQGRLYRMDRVRRRHRVRELLEAEGLWERRHDRVATWSRGMKQRLAIARALMPRPELVFLDEPTAGFDPQAAYQLRQKIRGLAKEDGATVFINTHHLHEAEAICDQVGVLFAGRLLVVGPPDRLREEEAGPLLRFVGSGFTPALVAALRRRRDVLGAKAADDRLEVTLSEGAEPWRVVQSVVRAGARVDEVQRHRSTLEQDFLALLEEVQ